MRAYVVGAGAIGTYLGEALARVGVDVRYAPRGFDAVTPVDADIALVTTKAFATPSAIATLRAAIMYPQKCLFVTPQNGIGNEELLAEAFGERNVVAAALTTPVERDADGRVAAANRGGLVLAPMADVAFGWLRATFASAGIPTRVTPDWRALKWSKLALNILANASCAILDLLPSELVRDPRLLSREIQAVRETHAVMDALGLRAVDLPRYRVRTLFAVSALPMPLGRALLAGRIARGRGQKPPSLLLDLREGKAQSEVGALCGAIAAHGQRCGVATPVNATFMRVLTEITQQPERWERYRGNPRALEGEIVAEVQGHNRHARPKCSRID